MNESLASINQWSKETFGPPTDIKVHALRVIEEAVEVCLAAGVPSFTIGSYISKVISKANAKLQAKYPGRDIREPEIQAKLLGEYGEELADVIITCASRTGIDHQAKVDAKMTVNRAREWRQDSDGAWRHSKKAPSEMASSNNGDPAVP